MGITLHCPATDRTADIGMMAFYRLRVTIATEANLDFGCHYAKIADLFCRCNPGQDREDALKAHLARAEELANEKGISQDLLDFLYMPDCAGSATTKACQEISGWLKGKNRSEVISYPGRLRPTTMGDVLDVLHDCTLNGCPMEWL